MTLPDIPLTPEATELLARIRPRLTSGLAEVDKTPVAVLVWGPGISSSSPLAECRLRLRTELRRRGHAAMYSEELCDPGCSFSIRLQQLVQAQAFDLVVSIPCTPGSIAEIHDFSTDRRVHGKTLVFLNREHLGGYSEQSLAAVSTVMSCRIEYYPNESDVGIIETVTYDEVQKIRELKYLAMGRY